MNFTMSSTFSGVELIKDMFQFKKDYLFFMNNNAKYRYVELLEFIFQTL